MAAKRKRKPLTKFPRHMQKKLLVTFSVIGLMLIGLIARLMYIENTSGEKYEKIVLSQLGYDSQTIPYQRGDIVDAKGTVLATSIAVYNVILDCSVMTSKEDYIDPTIQALLTCFPELDSEKLYDFAYNDEDNKYIILKKKAAYEEIQPFVELQEATNEKGSKINPNIKGVWFEKEYQREYPYAELASSVIGFTASGNMGVNGLEYYYNDTLNGINGREYGYLNSDNNFEKTIKSAVNGSNIVTTIDATIQTVVENKIAEFNEAYTNNYREGEAGATHIAVIMMNPNNGDVLAMANYPNYDLSNPRDLSGYYTEEEIAAMEEETKLELLNKIWQNYCLTYTYEPGSTAKPFTMAAGFETGTLLGTETYFCDGYEMVGGHRINCVNRSGHGMETVEQALMNSCNDALMQMSYSIGIDNFTKYQQIFGFGQKTNIDLPGETRTDSLIYKQSNMTPIDLATNAFGQNFNTTMIQLATAYCSLVNGGSLYQPRVVQKITDENGNTISNIEPTLLRETISKTTSDTLKGYMYATVTSGTGNTAKVDGYSMGGKTGTAQKIGEDGTRDRENYLLSFIGFAPVEDPQLVIYCIVDEPNVQEQWHSTFAQNIVREILEEVLPYMNIYRDEESTGLHAGWDITGIDVGDEAMTDVVNSELPVEEDLGDIPNTMGELTGEGEGTPEGETAPGGDTPADPVTDPEGDLPDDPVTDPGGDTLTDPAADPEGDIPTDPAADPGGTTP